MHLSEILLGLEAFLPSGSLTIDRKNNMLFLFSSFYITLLFFRIECDTTE
jgi:hypothetical protein